MLERLQKIIAAAGVASRRAAEQLITDGLVTVNGERVTELGARADPEVDHIKVRGRLIHAGRDKPRKYFLLNKPRGVLSSASDPKNRPLVIDILPAPLRRGLHPVGRLDFNTEGLIILTNDGELTRLLTQAGKVEKIYEVKVKGAPTDQQIDRLRRGMRLGDKRTAPAGLKLVETTRKGGNSWYEVTLREGKNQQIRRMFDSIGHSVTKLRRIRIGHLTADGLATGQYRELKESEVRRFLQPAPKKPDTTARKKRPASGRQSSSTSS
jgi:23S rRNA pseudouridine2605 synthase